MARPRCSKKNFGLVLIALLVMTILRLFCAKYDLSSHLVLDGDATLELREGGRKVLNRGCTVHEIEEILKWTRSVPPVGLFQVSFTTYAPRVTVHTREWMASFGESMVVLNCCPDEDGDFIQVTWGSRDEDLELREYLLESSKRQVVGK